MVCLKSLLETEYSLSAPQDFLISFQGEPELPYSFGGPGSLCHCQKAQANSSFGCPSLSETMWGCGSVQELQQETVQREHTCDESGYG